MYLKCPRCGGILYEDYDGYEGGSTCLACAREFNSAMIPRRMTLEDLKAHYNMELTATEKHASMRMECRNLK